MGSIQNSKFLTSTSVFFTWESPPTGVYTGDNNKKVFSLKNYHTTQQREYFGLYLPHKFYLKGFWPLRPFSLLEYFFQ